MCVSERGYDVREGMGRSSVPPVAAAREGICMRVRIRMIGDV